MMRTINFVRERQRRLSKQEAQDRVILRWSIIGFVVSILVILIVVGIRFFFVFRLQQVNTTQNGLRSAIKSKQDVEETFTIFSYKIKLLTELFGKRREKQEALEYFSTIFGPDVFIRQLSYLNNTEVLTFTLESKNVFVLKNVVEKMSSDEVKLKYPNIRKENMRRSGDGSYTMDITIALGTTPLPSPAAAPEDSTDSENAGAPTQVSAPAPDATQTTPSGAGL